MADNYPFIPADCKTLREMLGERRLRQLTYPKPTVTELTKRFDALAPEQLLAPSPVVSTADALCVKGALYERHDLYDAAHRCAQEAGHLTDEDTTSSYWHAICHRREPDYNNCKYWFRRVGKHPILSDLHRAVTDSLSSAEGNVAVTLQKHLEKKGEWDAFYWVDLCAEASRGKDTDGAKLLMEIQEMEWELLFEYTYGAAVGKQILPLK